MARRKSETALWDIFNKFESEHRNKLFLRNLPYWTSELDIFKILDNIVKDNVDTIRILEDQTNGLSAGFCCVSFKTASAVDKVKCHLSTNNDQVQQSSPTEWEPHAIRFSKYEFKKLIEEAKVLGRIRHQRDSDDQSDDIYDYELKEITSTKFFNKNNTTLPGQPVPINTFQPSPCHSTTTISNPPSCPQQVYNYGNSNLWPFSAPYPPLFQQPPPLLSMPYPITFPPMLPPPSYSNTSTVESIHAEKSKTNEKEMENFRHITSRAIRKATEAHLDGQTKEAKKILKIAIAEIEKSVRESNNKNYKILLWSLEDALLSMEENSSNHQECANRSTRQSKSPVKSSKSSPKSSRNIFKSSKSSLKSSKSLSKSSRCPLQSKTFTKASKTLSNTSRNNYNKRKEEMVENIRKSYSPERNSLTKRHSVNLTSSDIKRYDRR